MPYDAYIYRLYNVQCTLNTWGRQPFVVGGPKNGKIINLFC